LVDVTSSLRQRISDVVEPVAQEPVGQGITTHEISDELLEALTDAYRNMASGKSGG
jgi:hypothetical protein